MQGNDRGLSALLRTFLAETGSLAPAKLGEAVQPVIPSAEQTELLYARLAGQSKFNNRMIVVSVGLHCLILLAALGLAIRFSGSPTAVTVLGGGSLLSLLAVTRNLQKVWREKVGADMLSTILPNLEPSEAVKAIQAVYYQRQSEANQPRDSK